MLTTELEDDDEDGFAGPSGEDHVGIDSEALGLADVVDARNVELDILQMNGRRTRGDPTDQSDLVLPGVHDVVVRSFGTGPPQSSSGALRRVTSRSLTRSWTPARTRRD